MSVSDVRTDTEARTMTITATYEASAGRVWELWENPRLLERWWGPPTWPATFVDHDLTTGGRVNYFMTGPDGDKARGWWRVLSVDAPHRLEFEDGFADDNGEPDPDMPTMIIRVAIDEESEGSTRMAIETTFPSAQDMDRVLAMGMEEGMTLAVGQIDELLQEGVTP